MKISIHRESLAEAMRIVGAVIPSSTPKPILQAVRIVAGAKTVMLHGTNLDTTVTYDVGQVEVEEQGEAAVKASLFSAVVNGAVSDVLTIYTTDMAMHITEADAKYRLYDIPANDFPAVPWDASEYDAEVSLAEFREGVQRTAFAAATQVTKYAMDGVYLEQGGSRARLVATDGRRLAFSAVKQDREYEAKGIVPPKAMKVLASLVPDEGATIQVKVRERQAWFKCGPMLLVTNLAAGKFPNYEDIIPKECPINITLDRKATMRAIRQAAVMLPADVSGIVMSLSPNRLVFEAREGSTVLATASAPVSYAGEPMEIAFVPSVVTDALSAMKADLFRLALTAPDRPGMIHEGDYKYVFMPVTIG